MSPRSTDIEENSAQNRAASPKDGIMATRIEFVEDDPEWAEECDLELRMCSRSFTSFRSFLRGVKSRPPKVAEGVLASRQLLEKVLAATGNLSYSASSSGSGAGDPGEEVDLLRRMSLKHGLMLPLLPSPAFLDATTINGLDSWSVRSVYALEDRLYEAAIELFKLVRLNRNYYFEADRSVPMDYKEDESLPLFEDEALFFQLIEAVKEEVHAFFDTLVLMCNYSLEGSCRLLNALVTGHLDSVLADLFSRYRAMANFVLLSRNNKLVNKIDDNKNVHPYYGDLMAKVLEAMASLHHLSGLYSKEQFDEYFAYFSDELHAQVAELLSNKKLKMLQDVLLSLYVYESGEAVNSGYVFLTLLNRDLPNRLNLDVLLSYMDSAKSCGSIVRVSTINFMQSIVARNTRFAPLVREDGLTLGEGEEGGCEDYYVPQYLARNGLLRTVLDHFAKNNITMYLHILNRYMLPPVVSLGDEDSQRKQEVYSHLMTLLFQPLDSDVSLDLPPAYTSRLEKCATLFDLLLLLLVYLGEELDVSKKVNGRLLYNLVLLLYKLNRMDVNFYVIMQMNYLKLYRTDAGDRTLVELLLHLTTLLFQTGCYELSILVSDLFLFYFHPLHKTNELGVGPGEGAPEVRAKLMAGRNDLVLELVKRFDLTSNLFVDPDLLDRYLSFYRMLFEGLDYQEKSHLDVAENRLTFLFKFLTRELNAHLKRSGQFYLLRVLYTNLHYLFTYLSRGDGEGERAFKKELLDTLLTAFVNNHDNIFRDLMGLFTCTTKLNGMAYNKIFNRMKQAAMEVGGVAAGGPDESALLLGMAQMLFEHILQDKDLLSTFCNNYPNIFYTTFTHSYKLDRRRSKYGSELNFITSLKLLSLNHYGALRVVNLLVEIYSHNKFHFLKTSVHCRNYVSHSWGLDDSFLRDALVELNKKVLIRKEDMLEYLIVLNSHDRDDTLVVKLLAAVIEFNYYGHYMYPAPTDEDAAATATTSCSSSGGSSAHLNGAGESGCEIVPSGGSRPGDMNVGLGSPFRLNSGSDVSPTSRHTLFHLDRSFLASRARMDGEEGLLLHHNGEQEEVVQACIESNLVHFLNRPEVGNLDNVALLLQVSSLYQFFPLYIKILNKLLNSFNLLPDGEKEGPAPSEDGVESAGCGMTRVLNVMLDKLLVFYHYNLKLENNLARSDGPGSRNQQRFLHYQQQSASSELVLKLILTFFMHNLSRMVGGAAQDPGRVKWVRNAHRLVRLLSQYDLRIRVTQNMQVVLLTYLHRYLYNHYNNYSVVTSDLEYEKQYQDSVYRLYNAMLFSSFNPRVSGGQNGGVSTELVNALVMLLVNDKDNTEGLLLCCNLFSALVTSESGRFSDSLLKVLVKLIFNHYLNLEVPGASECQSADTSGTGNYKLDPEACSGDHFLVIRKPRRFGDLRVLKVFRLLCVLHSNLNMLVSVDDYNQLFETPHFSAVLKFLKEYDGTVRLTHQEEVVYTFEFVKMFLLRSGCGTEGGLKMCNILRMVNVFEAYNNDVVDLGDLVLLSPIVKNPKYELYLRFLSMFTSSRFRINLGHKAHGAAQNGAECEDKGWRVVDVLINHLYKRMHFIFTHDVPQHVPGSLSSDLAGRLLEEAGVLESGAKELVHTGSGNGFDRVLSATLGEFYLEEMLVYIKMFNASTPELTHSKLKLLNHLTFFIKNFVNAEPLGGRDPSRLRLNRLMYEIFFNYINLINKFNLDVDLLLIVNHVKLFIVTSFTEDAKARAEVDGRITNAIFEKLLLLYLYKISCGTASAEGADGVERRKELDRNFEIKAIYDQLGSLSLVDQKTLELTRLLDS